MTRFIVIFFVSLFPASVVAQHPVADTTRKLPEVVVKAYFSEQPLLRSPASATVITASGLSNHPPVSLVPALNSAPGVRMEERSPGSYRLSIRGSLLRSPFGIRNIKMYIDEIPITDAGGNTYLNSLDASAINGLTILKGAEASIYGANTGGVILLPLLDLTADSTALSASASGGSYGLFHEHLTMQKQWKDYQIQFKQAFQASEGYRQNSGMKRLYSQVSQRWQYAPGAQLKATILYSDLHYETPGGLTQEQVEQNPRLARPATPTVPGAVEQQAGIYNNTVLGGVVNEWSLKPNLRHVISVSAAYTDFKNPFITNYETRTEKTFGIRSYVELKSIRASWNWMANLGVESQQTASEINNFDNLAGQKGQSQSEDNLEAQQSFFFGNWMAEINKKVTLQASLSYNLYGYKYESSFPAITPERTQRMSPQVMPRLAGAWQLAETVGWRFSISRGYSPPTIAEVRASDQIINTDLEPETGWNYETGVRLALNNGRFYIDASTFSFKLTDAIVRRINAADAEYFVNAGGTRQQGIELQTTGKLISNNHHVINDLELRNSYTYSKFTFTDYINGNVNYGGNLLTGVPRHVLVTSLKLALRHRISIFAQHNFTSSIPLNDANTDFAKKYHLVQLKINWMHKKFKNGYRFETFVGIDNLLNESYSLGNDLNAFGGRYYNPAADTNYYAGLTINL